MLIATSEARFPTPPRGGGWPAATLRPDNWDDFGFRTSYDLSVFTGRFDRVDIGTVKILERGQEAGSPDVPALFEQLGPDLVSLGQDHEYYENLERLGPDIYIPVLSALNDLVFRPDLREGFSAEIGLTQSLLRFSSAQSALETAPGLFGTEDRPLLVGPIKLGFRTSVGGGPFDIDLEFLSHPQLPGHISAVIGANGSGKTQLLANLAFIASATGLSESNEATEPRRGQLLESNVGTISGIVAVSYSAFDTFSIPSGNTTMSSTRGSSFGYTYLGIRAGADAGNANGLRLKSPADLAADFRRALTRARSRERIEGLEAVLRALLSDPSFARANLEVRSFRNLDNALELFDGLSTGHKIVLCILVGLISQLQPRTLVLIDEPETHLHPPLVAAFIAALEITLGRYESLAVVATHSPVVIQTVPGRQVTVLRRFGDRTVADGIEVETFAESIGLLTRMAFSLDNSTTTFDEVLEGLAERYSEGEADAIFETGLSNQGRALFSLFREDEEGEKFT